MKLKDRVNELAHILAVFEHRLEALEEDKNDTIERLKKQIVELEAIGEDKNDTIEKLKKQIVEFSRELYSSNIEIAVLKEEKEKLSGRLSEAVEIIKEYVKISLTEPETRSMIDEVELFKKAQEFLSKVEE